MEKEIEYYINHTFKPNIKRKMISDQELSKI